MQNAMRSLRRLNFAKPVAFIQEDSKLKEEMFWIVRRNRIDDLKKLIIETPTLINSLDQVIFSTKHYRIN